MFIKFVSEKDIARAIFYAAGVIASLALFQKAKAKVKLITNKAAETAETAETANTEAINLEPIPLESIDLDSIDL